LPNAEGLVIVVDSVIAIRGVVCSVIGSIRIRCLSLCRIVVGNVNVE
jgi:hypothetical protein